MASSRDHRSSSLLEGVPAVPLAELLGPGRRAVEEALAEKPVAQSLRLFFSFSDGTRRATVVQFAGRELDDIFPKLAQHLQRTFKTPPRARWLRIDWVTEIQQHSWKNLVAEMRQHKRNYFRRGIALDSELRYAFLEQELNANAMLYPGGKVPHANLNERNFTLYARGRYHPRVPLDFRPEHEVYSFTTAAVLIEAGQTPVRLHGFTSDRDGRHVGRRIIEHLDATTVRSLVERASRFLAEQVTPSGRFVYGMHPCFDREIDAYNTLRHASTTYSMLEAWEVTQDDDLKWAIDRSLGYLTTELIRDHALPDGRTAAFLLDSGDEIKLGGNAVCLLALVKYIDLTGEREWLPLLERLAVGITYMQDARSGQFCHVLNAGDLSLKERFRIIYYDGEATFGLMRLYGLTGDARWLACVEKAFNYFIAQEHWKVHDHWLSYCVNELTLYRPEERYFRFGIQNVASHLDFVIERITTFPTLLELMMAAHRMVTRLQRSESHGHLLDSLDLDKFYHALEARAHYLLNGHFWPELAMFFRNPQRILGSFFIRHHAFRVRIDDVEHYLSGFVAYLQHYLTSYGPQAADPQVASQGATRRPPSPCSETAPGREHARLVGSEQSSSGHATSSVTNVPRAVRGDTSATLRATPLQASLTPPDRLPEEVSEPVANWTARRLAEATAGHWLRRPMSTQWQATGVSFTPLSLEAGHLVVVRPEGGKRGITPQRLASLPFQPQGLIAQTPLPEGLPKNVPLYEVPDVDKAILDMGYHARGLITGKIIGVTGSAGKTSCVTMLQQLLSHFGTTGATQLSANLPHGIAWTLASLPWQAPYQVIEMAIGRMPQNTALARPDVAVFLNAGPAHLEYHGTTENVVRKKSVIFDGMSQGSMAVIHRDMPGWPIVERAARERGLQILGFGEHPGSDIRWVRRAEPGEQEQILVDETLVSLPTAGQGPHWVMNVMAAFGVLKAMELPITPVIPFLSRLEPAPGRGRWLQVTLADGRGRVTLIDDAYNANPLSMQAMLSQVGSLNVSGRKHLVLGDMLELGENRARYHAELLPGIIESGAKRLWLVGEEMTRLAPELRRRVGHAEVFASAGRLLQALEPDLADRDLVVFKGSNKFGLSKLAQKVAR